uniref:Calponin-homology (CH) domain-containing protein n=1 Tax=Poecilia reticulata TaxID=8081 RepID=A0A3P9NKF4_POERE
MWTDYRSESHLNAHLYSLMCCADERDRVQKKTFTKWVNKHLIKVRKHITDLYEDLRDGHNLISLLEVLSGVTLPREKGRMRFHRLQNVQIALDFLKQRQVTVPTLNQHGRFLTTFTKKTKPLDSVSESSLMGFIHVNSYDEFD